MQQTIRSMTEQSIDIVTTPKRIAVKIALATVSFWIVSPGNAAEDPAKGDLRDIRVGSPASEIPADGYVRRRCVMLDGSNGDELSGWTDFARCPQRGDELREVAFEYDESKSQWAAVNDKWEGTKVSGHPVLLSLLFDENGIAKALHINTDPSARAYMRKKAFLLRLRVMGRYGRDGWACAPPASEAEPLPLGGMLVNERCVKEFAGRELTLTTKLYRTADQPDGEYTNSTRLEIVWLGEG